MRFRGAVLTGSIAALAWLAPGVAQAAPPGNDALADATTLTVGVPVTGTLTEATSQAPDPTPGSRNVWYAFQTPGKGTWTVDVCGTAVGPRPDLRVYDTATLPTQVADVAQANCDDGTGSQRSFTTTGVKNLRFAVNDGAPAMDASSFTIRLSVGPNTQALAFKPAIADPRAVVLTGGTGTVDNTCSIDGAAAAACNASISLAGLTGSHVLHATGRDADGHPDATPLAYPFTIDQTPPDTTATVNVNTPETPAIDGQSSEPGALLTCSVDGMPYAQCDAGSGLYPSNLCSGSHTVRVAALDTWSNRDPTPAAVNFTVPAGRPCTTPRVRVEGDVGPPFGIAPSMVVDGGGQMLSAHFEYGPTAAYGFRSIDLNFGNDLTNAEYDNGVFRQTSLIPVGPGETVHFRAVARTADGTTYTTPDQTATGPAPPAGTPILTLGTPIVTQTTADIPYTLGGFTSPFTPAAAYLSDFSSLAAVPFVDVAVVPADGLQHGGTFRLTGLTPATRYSLAAIIAAGNRQAGTSAFAFTTASPPGPPAPGGGGGGGGTPPGSKPSGPPPKAKNPLGKLTLPKKLLLRQLKLGAFKPKLGCKSACRLRVRLLKGKVTIALGTAKRTKVGTSTISLKPTVAGRRVIRKVKHGKKLKLILLAEALDTSGKKSIGSIKRTVTFR